MQRWVMIDGRLIGYRRGGIATYATQLAELTPGLSSDVDIRLAIKKPIPRFSDRSVRVFTPPHHPIERFAFGLEVWKSGADLVHATDYVQPLAPGIPAVVTAHDLAFLSNPSFVTPDSRRYYNQFIETGPLAERVIAVSDYTKRQILERTRVDPNRIRVIPNGYDPRLFHLDATGDELVLNRIHPEIRSIARSERPIVLAVGTVEPRKRFEILVDSFDVHYDSISSVSGSMPVFVLVGQAGWLADVTISRLRSLHRRDRAIWLRDVNNRELAALYRSASLLVMPSFDEGFGLPVLEAMASGTPSLVASTGAMPELVADAGFVEDSAEPENWSRKIGMILDDSEIRQRRRLRGIERAEPRTWYETARRTVEIYREVLNA